MFAIISCCRYELEQIKIYIDEELSFKAGYYSDFISLPMNKLDWELLPSLVLAASAAGPKNDGRALSIAWVIQNIYMAHKIHALVSQEDLPERSRQCAVLIGDYLLGRAFYKLSQSQLFIYARDFANLTKTINEGVVQRWSLKKTRFSSEEYKSVLGKERASTAALTCKVISHMSGLNDDKIKILERIGYNIGMAWAVWEESLGLNSSIEYTAKAKGLIKELDDSDCAQLLLDVYSNFSDYIGCSQTTYLHRLGYAGG